MKFAALPFAFVLCGASLAQDECVVPGVVEHWRGWSAENCDCTAALAGIHQPKAEGFSLVGQCKPPEVPHSIFRGERVLTGVLRWTYSEEGGEFLTFTPSDPSLRRDDPTYSNAFAHGTMGVSSTVNVFRPKVMIDTEPQCKQADATLRMIQISFLPDDGRTFDTWIDEAVVTEQILYADCKDL